MKAAIVHNIPIHYKHLLFDALRKQGLDFEVLFIASGSSIRHERIALSEDAYRYRIVFEGPYEEAPPGRSARWVWSALEDIRPSVIVVGSYNAAECWSAWFWAFVHRVPIVMWYTGNEFDYPRHWPKELLKRIFLAGCAGAQVYGLSNKAYIVKLGLPSQDVIIKRAVVDIAKFETGSMQKRYRRDGLTRLIYVGRLSPEKNVSTLIGAFAQAARSESQLRLTIAGIGPCEAALRAEVAALGMEDLVNFTGYIGQKDLPALYRQSDFFVLPSVREPWGLVSLEAMLCRLPVLISTQCGCAADVVTPRTGWSFSPWNQSELSTLIQALPALGAAQIERMGEAAHDLACDYSPDNCAFAILESLGRLKGRSSRIGSNSRVEFAR
jgi:glycosyltransferase involved in cell wall biosynthesis